MSEGQQCSHKLFHIGPCSFAQIYQGNMRKRKAMNSYLCGTFGCILEDNHRGLHKFNSPLATQRKPTGRLSSYDDENNDRDNMTPVPVRAQPPAAAEGAVPPTPVPGPASLSDDDVVEVPRPASAPPQQKLKSLRKAGIELVWGKVVGHPWWPGRVESQGDTSNTRRVRFFMGLAKDGSCADLPNDKILPYLSTVPDSKAKSTADLEAAKGQARRVFELAAGATPTPAEKEEFVDGEEEAGSDQEMKLEETTASEEPSVAEEEPVEAAAAEEPTVAVE